jgi:predicted TIM-barrel fold metal-dependent hydrolase
VQATAEQYNYPILLRTSYEMSASDIEQQVITGGFLGLKPYLSNCPPYIPVKEIRICDFLPHEHLQVANKHGWIIMLHIPRDMRFRDPVNLAQLLEIEEKYPNVKLIVAHIGRAYAKEDFGDAFEVLSKTKKMYFDFTANLCDDAIEACIRTFGTKRLIFGSDLPIAIMRMYRIVEDGVYYNVVPRGLYGDVSGQAHMRESDETDITIMIYEQLLALKRVAMKLQLSKEDIKDIMYGNAKRLLDSF